MRNFSQVKFKTTLKVLITSIFSTLACVGVIYAASTIGSNITTTGSLSVTATTTIDTDTFFVDATNNRVGIGLTNPSNDLHVYNANGGIIRVSDGGTTHTVLGAANSIGGYVGTLNNISFGIRTNNIDQIFIEDNFAGSDVRIGIGTSSPLTKFSVQGTAGIPLFNIASSTGASLFYIKENGNLGIGTTTPQYKLDVNGDVNITSGTVYRLGGSTILNASSTLFNLYGGFNSGRSITTGYWNTFYGIGSGELNTVGNYNTFLGLSVGTSNTSGNNNTFVGGNSGQNNTTGDANTFLGETSGVNNTTGGYNTFLGWSSGSANTSGAQNSFIGYQSGINNITGGSNIFLGYKAGYNETGSNKLYITNSNTVASSSLIYGEFDNNILSFNAKVGIGTSTPSTKLEIHDTATSTVSVISETAGKGGRIILEDSDGTGCTEIYVLDGAIIPAVVACPAN